MQSRHEAVREPARRGPALQTRAGLALQRGRLGVPGDSVWFHQNNRTQPNHLRSTGYRMYGLDGQVISRLSLSLDLEKLETGHWNISETTMCVKRTQLAGAASPRGLAGGVTRPWTLLSSLTLTVSVTFKGEQEVHFTPSHCL